MKNQLRYLTIGVLIGIIVMQWTMPTGKAGVIAPPAGEVVAVAHQYLVTRDGRLWRFNPQYDPAYPSGFEEGTLPMPVENVKFFSYTPGYWALFWIVDASGNVWVKDGVSHWRDCGPPPAQPVPTRQETWGGVEGKYEGE
jgi:hypothetical protein